MYWWQGTVGLRWQLKNQIRTAFPSISGVAAFFSAIFWSTTTSRIIDSNMDRIQMCGWGSNSLYQQYLGGHFHVLIESHFFCKGSSLAKQPDLSIIYRTTKDGTENTSRWWKSAEESTGNCIWRRKCCFVLYFICLSYATVWAWDFNVCSCVHHVGRGWI